MAAARALGYAAASLALFAAGCGAPRHGPAPASNAAATNTVGQAAGAAPSTTAVASPSLDSLPDRDKVEALAADLERRQDVLVAADAGLLHSVRASLQSGSQDSAKLALSQYVGLVRGQLSGMPQIPPLAGCYAKAQPPMAAAETASAALLADRRDKAAAIGAVADRPLTLPDFGPLASDISGGPQAVADIKANLESARQVAAQCGAERPHVQAERAPRPNTAAQAPVATPAATPVEAPAAPPPAEAPATPPPAPAPAPPAPAKKPSFFERLKHALR
jgi:hypothetical protein